MQFSQYDYKPGSLHRSSKGDGSYKKRNMRCKQGNARDKRTKTKWKRRFTATPGQTTAEYRIYRREMNTSRKRWTRTLDEIKQMALIRLEAQRRIESNSVIAIQASTRGYLVRNRKPQCTTALLNCGSKEDVKPYVAVTSEYIIGFGYDGHGGKHVTNHIAGLLKTTLEEISSKGALNWVNERREECKNFYSGGMITCFSGYRLPNNSWSLDISWLGDAPFAALLSDGSTWIKQDHIPFAFEGDDAHDPMSLGYIAIPSRIVRWEITPDGKMAMSQRREQAVYCKCKKTGRMVASFTVLGDSGSFFDIPTGHSTIIVPSGSRLIWGSDGWSDVIHPEDSFFRQPNLTAQMVIDEAHARWTTRKFKSIDLDKYKAGQDTPDLHEYSGFGIDDISVGVLDLP